MEKQFIYLVIEAVSWETIEIKAAFYKKEDAEKFIIDNKMDKYASSVEEMEIK